MMESFREYISEAVRVSDERYMRAHGKKPRAAGQSAWMFSTLRTGKPDYNDDNTFFQARGSLSDAKKSAVQWAKQKGHEMIYIME